MIKSFEEFKRMNEAEISPAGTLVGFEPPVLGTREYPIEISDGEYFELNLPEFIAQSRPNEDGNYRMVWKVGETYYVTRRNIYD